MENKNIEKLLQDFDCLLPNLEKNGYCKEEGIIKNIDAFKSYSTGLDETELSLFLAYSRISKENEGNFKLFNQAGEIAKHYYFSKIMDENEIISALGKKNKSIKSAEEIFSKRISSYKGILKEIDLHIESIKNEFKII